MYSLPNRLAPRVSTRGATLRLASILAVLGILACEEDKAPTAPATMEAQSAAISPAAANVTAAGTIPLPINQTVSSPGVALGITQNGTGPAGSFKITSPTNTANVLLGQTAGAGIAVRGVGTGNNARAGSFEIINSVNNQNALTATTTGTGTALSASTSGVGIAGLFFRTAASSSPTLLATSPGNGPAIQARAFGSTNAAAQFDTPGTTGSTPTLDVSSRSRGHVGYFHRELGSAANSNSVLRAVTAMSTGGAGNFEVANTSSNATALSVNNQGTGWAGDFSGKTHGVRIATTDQFNGTGLQITTTNAGVGLQVIGGSKQAVVNTTTGARSLYTEESSEVWFTDYGFGRLQNGRARILIEPGFAQTVSLDQPYHVFVQPYGDAEIYVSARTNLGFVVVGRDGDPNAEFGYRIVAKRAGFEGARLERAPWADHSPSFQQDGR